MSQPRPSRSRSRSVRSLRSVTRSRSSSSSYGSPSSTDSSKPATKGDVRKILAKLDQLTEKINNPPQKPTNLIQPLNFKDLKDFEEYDFQLVNEDGEKRKLVSKH
jgi:hypothetical protein